jgi:hypothetical protein
VIELVEDLSAERLGVEDETGDPTNSTGAIANNV